MRKRLKRIHNPLAPLEYIWLSTPSPGYDDEWGKQAASLARPGFRLKADAAIQALVDNRFIEKSWARKKVENALELELAWCRMALADTLRWGICCGLEAEDIQGLARTIPPVPVSMIEKEQLIRELTARFLCEQEDPKAAFATTLQLYAVLAPSIDITTLEQVALAVNSHAMHRLSFSAGVEMVFTAAFAGIALWARFWFAALASMVPDHWSAKSTAAAIAFSAGRFLTQGLTRHVAGSVGKLYAVWVVRAKLKGVDGLEPLTGFRRPGYALPEPRCNAVPVEKPVQR